MRTCVALLAVAVTACNSDTSGDNQPQYIPPPHQLPHSRPNSASNEPAPIAETGTVKWPAPFTPGSPCGVTARQAATIWMRPTDKATQFGQLAVGDNVQLVAQTADGWVGFNPGTAQAANVGIFRLRWVRAAEAFGKAGSCGQLPVVAALPTGCLLMAAQPLVVREQPADGASVLGTVPVGSYAQLARAGAAAGQWAEVLLPGRRSHGYVATADASFAGECK